MDVNCNVVGIGWFFGWGFSLWNGYMVIDFDGMYWG